jgi:hypothetical protein
MLEVGEKTVSKPLRGLRKTGKELEQELEQTKLKRKRMDNRINPLEKLGKSGSQGQL